jgi:NAD(P)-dependent dehydrogenase (short-subunit alcohol dehydrogenase family)
MSKAWTLSDVPSQAGKRFFITGANSGIGYYAAVELARRGAVVVLACRDKARGEAALRQLRVDAAGPESAAAQAELVVLDLASLDSVREVAEAEVARRVPLHGLINNAGVMAPAQRRETKDGFELQFGTNVLGHFALTCRLLQALEMGCGADADDAARVVTLSSIAHKRGRINFDDLQSERSYNPMGAYQQSKLADLMFALKLERRLRATMRGTRSLAVHPGIAKTPLFKVGSSEGISALAERTLQNVLGVLFNSGPEGALPTVYAATMSSAKGGGYYGPQGFLETRGGDAGPANIARQALDETAQQKLWSICEELTGISLGG